MSIEKNIGELFEDENLQEQKTPAQPEEKKELPKLEAPHERREFTRINVASQNIEVRFQSGLQFAKQYMENISAGGMFIKTSEKHKMGEIVPVAFTVRDAKTGNDLDFNLRGKVCRVSPEGFGVEFTNLSEEIRKQLEEFIQSILPQGAEIRSKAKTSTLERLEQIRERKRKEDEKRKNFLYAAFAIVVLAWLNFYMFQQFNIEPAGPRAPAPQEQIVFQGRKIDPNSVRTLEVEEHGNVTMEIENGERITANSAKDFELLPYAIKRKIEFLQNMPKIKPPRESINNPNERVILR